MRYVHTKCSGTIDLKKRQCLKCGRKWNRLSLWLDPKEIRPVTEPGDMRPKRSRQEEITTIQQLISERIPGGKYAVFVANHYLPNWPTWARVLSTLLVLGGLVYLITWLVWLR